MADRGRRGESSSGLTDAQLRDIGRVAVAFSDIEGLVWNILIILMNPHEPQVGRLVVGGDSIDAQLGRIERLLDLRFAAGDSDRAQLIKWLGQVRELKEQRNKMVHSVWIPGDSRAVL